MRSEDCVIRVLESVVKNVDELLKLILFFKLVEPLGSLFQLITEALIVHVTKRNHSTQIVPFVGFRIDIMVQHVHVELALKSVLPSSFPLKGVQRSTFKVLDLGFYKLFPRTTLRLCRYRSSSLLGRTSGLLASNIHREQIKAVTLQPSQRRVYCRLNSSGNFRSCQ